MNVLEKLKLNYPSPKDRPRSIFYLTGEGAKLAFLLYKYRSSFRGDDIFLVSCESERKCLIEWTKGLESRIFVAPYPVNTKLFNTRRPRLNRNDFNLPARANLVLYAGRISEQKNILMLFEYLAQRPHDHLVLAGEIDRLGFPHLAQVKQVHFPFAIAQVVERFKLEDRVHFLANQSQSDLAQLMKLCDQQISLSTHFGEDFGYSIAQGIHCGLQTLLSNWGGHQTWQNFSEIKRKSASTKIQYLDVYFEKNKQGHLKLRPNFEIHPSSCFVDSKKLGSIVNQKIEEQIRAALSFKADATNSYEINQNIKKFWKTHLESSRDYMFKNTKDSLYQSVLKNYGARWP